MGSDAVTTEQGIMTDVKSTIYSGIKDAFTGAYGKCNPTGYSSTAVNSQCKHVADQSQVEICSNSTEYPLGYAGVYCKDGPGLEPFTIDKGVSFPNPEDGLSLSNFYALRSFGALVNYACAPTLMNYTAYNVIIKALSMGTAINGDATDAFVDRANVTFADCYNSDWWAETAGALTKGPAMSTEPNSEDPLPDEQAQFYSGSLTLAELELSPKMVFCTCATKGKDSVLWKVLTTAGEYSKWISLGLAVFLFFTFISACYLLCCKRDAVEELMGKKQNNPFDHGH